MSKNSVRGWALCASAALVGAIAFTSCGGGELDDEALGIGPPYPGFSGQDYSGEKNFAVLLNSYAQSKSANTPWAGFWWPYTKNGIASGTHGGGGSPAGKYDAARGGRTQSQRWEVSNHGAGVRGVQGWWGHCNGWCVAAALFPEPREAKTVNGIRFGIADIKALLTEAGMESSADFYGNRVDWGRDFNTPKVDDPVPNQYFLVLTNYMGKLREPVLIDRFTGNEVWNQPVAGYKFDYPKPGDYLGASPDAPNVYRIRVSGTLWWSNDGVAPDVVTPDFEYQSDGYYFQSRDLTMELWVDAPVEFGADGKITKSGDLIVTRQGEYFVGGTWLGASNNTVDGHPDYMWIPYSMMKPTEYANPHIDIEWVKKHVVAGVDDPSVSPRPIDPAPNPSSRPSDEPTSSPRPTPTSTPRPTPTFTFPIPTPEPTPPPTGTPRPPDGGDGGDDDDDDRATLR